jgi:hypothetical protein
VALSFRNRNTRKGRANGRTDWRRNGATHQPTKFPTKGSRHPGCRRARSLRGGASAQGLGPREGTGALQGEPGSDGENLYLGRLRETTRGVRGTRRRGFHGRESPVEPSLRGRDPCRTTGNTRRAPNLLELVHGGNVYVAQTVSGVRESDGREIGRERDRRRHGSSLGR